MKLVLEIDLDVAGGALAKQFRLSESLYKLARSVMTSQMTDRDIRKINTAGKMHMEEWTTTDNTAAVLRLSISEEKFDSTIQMLDPVSSDITSSLVFKNNENYKHF